ncbi:HAD domain-containing protein [Sphingobium sp. ba1]|jgi:hypothetical protein|uniref:HAD domain-containing protein n=1 Tax=Sphingobium sp. ba1 TaxID=1522072 RepID=UPI00056A807F|nr:HAD domain-containing protein [Sphingobium sp. ba1]
MSDSCTDKTPRVIFLDIDGPMIPGTMFLIDRMCSFHRVFPATTIAVINEVCKRTGAKVVLNTTHNRPFENVPDIVDAMVNFGFDRGHFHAFPKTMYPDIPRDLAVKEWLNKRGDCDWIAFDDARFTDDERLIWIDPDCGLHLGYLNDALERFGEAPCLILM